MGSQMLGNVMALWVAMVALGRLAVWCLAKRVSTDSRGDVASTSSTSSSGCDGKKGQGFDRLSPSGRREAAKRPTHTVCPELVEGLPFNCSPKAAQAPRSARVPALHR